ncbi:MAG: replication initiation protein [Cyclobacteriaceae bacterium]
MIFNHTRPTKIVAQHNQLLNGHYSFDINELRIFVYMLLSIRKDDTEFKEVFIPCLELTTSTRVHYERIKSACKSLAKKTIEVEKLNKKGTKTFSAIPLMSYCEYKEGDGALSAQFNEYAKPYLLNLKDNFTATQFKQFMNISSFWSYRVYWLLKQYEDFGYREFTISKFKQLLGLEDKYPLFADFRKRVLDPVQKELASMDMAFCYQAKKKNRKYDSLVFTFGHRNKSVNLFPSKSILSPVAQKEEVNTQMATGFDQHIHMDQFDRFLFQHKFTLTEIEDLKQLAGNIMYKKVIYSFQTNDQPTIHPKDVRNKLITRFQNLAQLTA